MKKMYPKFIIVFMIVLITFMINFRYQKEPEIPQASPQQVVKKVVVIKKVYIRVPSVNDSTGRNADTTIITLPKEAPAPNYKKYFRSKNLHKNGFIS